MKRILSLCLTLILLGACLVPVAAEEGEAGPLLTLVVGETPTAQPQAESYVLPAAEKKEGSVFVGWYADAVGDTPAVLLPAGATFTIEKDMTLTALYVKMAVREGAVLRMDNYNGLRFLTDIDSADLAFLRARATVSFGTVIAPSSYARGSGNSLNPIDLAQNGYEKYLEIPTGTPYEVTDTTVTVAGSVVNILSENIGLDYAGCGYLRVTYTDGSVGKVFAAPNYMGMHRLYMMAYNAFAEGNITAIQTAFIKGILNKAVNLSITSVSGSTTQSTAVINPESLGYLAPYTAVYDEPNGKFTLTVRPDSTYRFNKDFYLLVLGGSPMSQNAASKRCTISEDGKIMVVLYDASSGSY